MRDLPLIASLFLFYHDYKTIYRKINNMECGEIALKF